MSIGHLHDNMKTIYGDSPFIEGRTTFIVGCGYGYDAKINPFFYDTIYENAYENLIDSISNIHNKTSQKEIELHSDKTVVQYLWNQTVKNNGENDGYTFISVPRYFEKYVEYIEGIDSTENIRINYRKMILETENDHIAELISIIKNTNDEFIEIQPRKK